MAIIRNFVLGTSLLAVYGVLLFLLKIEFASGESIYNNNNNDKLHFNEGYA